MASLDMNREKTLELTVGAIERQFGKGSIMRMTADAQALAPGIQVIPTISIGLNLALGIGGFPRGRIVEIYGPESSGKTTLALHALAEAQRMLANEAVNGFLYQPQWVTVANKNVKGLWKDVPIFANDLSALSWGG